MSGHKPALATGGAIGSMQLVPPHPLVHLGFWINQIKIFIKKSKTLFIFTHFWAPAQFESLEHMKAHRPMPVGGGQKPGLKSVLNSNLVKIKAYI